MQALRSSKRSLLSHQGKLHFSHYRGLQCKECNKRFPKTEFNSPRETVNTDISRPKDYFLETDDESRDSLDMNEVTSINMERKYAAIMKVCSDLNRLKHVMAEMQSRLSRRTEQFLNSDSVSKIIMTYKVQQMGLKSEYDIKQEGLKQEKGTKEAIISKIINKNKVLILEKNRHLNLLKKKGQKDRQFDYKNIMQVLE